MKYTTILLLTMIVCRTWATEIETPLAKFALEAKCFDIALMGKSNVKEVPKSIIIPDTGVPVSLFFEGKRTVTIESGLASKIKIQTDKDVLAHVIAIHQAFKDYVIDNSEYNYSKRFDGKSEILDMMVKCKKSNSGPGDTVFVARYVEINGKYLFMCSDGFFTWDRSTNEQKIQWQGYPDRDPQIRTLFIQEIK